MPFRHIIKNFVIQGGDFDFDGTAQEWITKAKASGKNDLRFVFLIVDILNYHGFLVLLDQIFYSSNFLSINPMVLQSKARSLYDWDC
jgi:cyclophilin family peptidyl-prolyl cis-trans isomerase